MDLQQILKIKKEIESILQETIDAAKAKGVGVNSPGFKKKLEGVRMKLIRKFGLTKNDYNTVEEQIQKADATEKINLKEKVNQGIAEAVTEDTETELLQKEVDRIDGELETLKKENELRRAEIVKNNIFIKTQKQFDQNSIKGLKSSQIEGYSNDINSLKLGVSESNSGLLKITTSVKSQFETILSIENELKRTKIDLDVLKNAPKVEGYKQHTLESHLDSPLMRKLLYITSGEFVKSLHNTLGGIQSGIIDIAGITKNDAQLLFLGITSNVPIALPTIIGNGGKAIRINIGATAFEYYTPAGDTDEKVKYDSADPTAGYLADKIIAGTGITIAEGTGANENKLQISFSGSAMIYPGAGIPLSTGSAWGTSITNNSTNWNTAYGWGNHASAGYLTSISGLTASDSAKLNGQSASYYQTALGFTPVTNARTLTINGTTYDLTANRSWTISTGSPSFGATKQIPYMNTGGTDFLYSANLTFDGNKQIILGQQEISASRLLPFKVKQLAADFLITLGADPTDNGSAVVTVPATTDNGSYADTAGSTFNGLNSWLVYVVQTNSGNNVFSDPLQIDLNDASPFDAVLNWNVSGVDSPFYIVQSPSGYYITTYSLTLTDNGDYTGWTAGTFAMPYPEYTSVSPLYYVWALKVAPDGKKVGSGNATIILGAVSTDRSCVNVGWTQTSGADQYLVYNNNIGSWKVFGNVNGFFDNNDATGWTSGFPSGYFDYTGSYSQAYDIADFKDNYNNSILKVSNAGVLINGVSIINYWTESTGIIYPTTTTDRLLIGGATDDTIHAIQVLGAISMYGASGLQTGFVVNSWDPSFSALNAAKVRMTQFAGGEAMFSFNLNENLGIDDSGVSPWVLAMGYNYPGSSNQYNYFAIQTQPAGGSWGAGTIYNPMWIDNAGRIIHNGDSLAFPPTNDGISTVQIRKGSTDLAALFVDGPINNVNMPTADPVDGKGTFWYDPITNIVYRGT